MSYQVTLAESYFPAQSDLELRDLTIGDQLRETAQQYPDKTGLVEVDIDGNTARSWTYTELLVDSESLAQALSSIRITYRHC